MIEWHRLLGLTIEDYFSDTAYKVELEKDLSKQRQLLDVVIVKKETGKSPDEFPDGLDNLKSHNLISYKSHQDILDDWSVRELQGHHVTYRKLVSPSLRKLIPETEFQLYAISARYPQSFFSEVENFKQIKDGVYDARCTGQTVRIIVLSRVPKVKRNAIWQLFSADPEGVKYGAENYEWRKPDVSTIINELLEKYKIEGIAMPYTKEDFIRDYVLEHINELSADEILKKLSIEDRLKGLSKDELLKRLSKEDRLKGLSVKDVLSNLPPEEIEALKKELREKRGRKFKKFS